MAKHPSSWNCPHGKEYLAQNTNSAKMEGPCTLSLHFSLLSWIEWKLNVLPATCQPTQQPFAPSWQKNPHSEVSDELQWVLGPLTGLSQLDSFFFSCSSLGQEEKHHFVKWDREIVNADRLLGKPPSHLQKRIQCLLIWPVDTVVQDMSLYMWAGATALKAWRKWMKCKKSRKLGGKPGSLMLSLSCWINCYKCPTPKFPCHRFSLLFHRFPVTCSQKYPNIFTMAYSVSHGKNIGALTIISFLRIVAFK